MRPESSYTRFIPVSLRPQIKLYGCPVWLPVWGCPLEADPSLLPRYEMSILLSNWDLAQLFLLPLLLVCLNPPSLSLPIYFQSSQETSGDDRFLYYSCKFFVNEARKASPMLSWNQWNWPKHTVAKKQIAKMFPCPAQAEITHQEFSGGSGFEFQ